VIQFLYPLICWPFLLPWQILENQLTRYL